MLVGWGILSPLSKHMGWAPGPVGDMTTGARGWILWTSLAIMCADSVVSLLPVAWEFVRKAAKRHNPDLSTTDSDEVHNKPDDETETEDRLVPGSWVCGGYRSASSSGLQWCGWFLAMKVSNPGQRSSVLGWAVYSVF